MSCEDHSKSKEKGGSMSQVQQKNGILKIEQIVEYMIIHWSKLLGNMCKQMPNKLKKLYSFFIA